MNEKEAKKLATLVKKVAKAPEHLSIYAKEISFSERDMKFIREHQEEFIEALNNEDSIQGYVQYKDSFLDDLDSEEVIWFEN